MNVLRTLPAMVKLYVLWGCVTAGSAGLASYLLLAAGARWPLWLALAAQLAAAVATLVWLSATLRRPARQALQLAQRMAAGDLGTDLPASTTTDPLLVALAAVQARLGGAIATVRGGLQELSMDAGRLVIDNQQLARGADTSLAQYVATTAASAAALRDRAGSLARVAAAFVLAADHPAAQSGLQLVASKRWRRIDEQTRPTQDCPVTPTLVRVVIR